MSFEINAAVILVRAVLGNDLDLSATVASIFRIVVVREDLNFLNGVLVRRDDGSAAPSNTGGSHAVDLVIIFSCAGAAGSNLATVFNFEDAVRTASATNVGSGKVLRTAPTTGVLAAIAKGSGSKLEELKRIAPKRGQLLNVLVGYGALEVRRFGIDQRSGVAAYRHGF